MALQNITGNERAGTLLDKVNGNFGYIRELIGSSAPAVSPLSDADDAEDVCAKINSNFGDLEQSTQLAEVSADEDSSDFVQKLNNNFSTLEAEVEVDPSSSRPVTVYDLSCGKGSRYYPCDIRAGQSYIVHYDAKSTDATSPDASVNLTVRSYSGDKNTKILQESLFVCNKTSGIVHGGSNGGLSTGWGNPFVATKDANYIYVLNSDNAGLQHDEVWSAAAISSNPWHGKKWLMIGDSISTEAERWEKRYQQRPYNINEGYAHVGYGMLIARDFGLRRYNISRSGKATSDFINITGGVVNWKNFTSSFDLITVMLGTNDNGFNQGSLYISNCQSLYNLLHEKWPSAKIVFITPIKRWGSTTSAQNTYDGLATMVTNLKNWCSTNSIPCIDLYNDDAVSGYTAIDPVEGGEGLSPVAYRIKYFFPATDSAGDGLGAGDGTHPNDLGQEKFLYPRIKEWFENNTPNE